MPELETVSWAELGPYFLKSWGRPDGRIEAEHISIVGPTRSGKSKFLTTVIDERAKMRGSHILYIATKPADNTLRKIGWPVIRKYPPPYGKHERFILWPETSRNEIESKQIQHDTIRQALTDIWIPDSNVIVGFDEIAYVQEELKLKTLIERYYREGSALGITVAATTQRPRNVTRYMWSEPAWFVAFRPPDEDEARRVAEIIGGKRSFITPLLNLRRHEFILINRTEREAYISKLGT
jgi:hypothetical protein